MAGQASSRQRFSPGFFVRYRTIWFSEFLANIVIGLLLIFLMSITGAILLNSRAIRLHDERIASLKADSLARAHSIAGIREELRVLTLLRNLAGTKAADRTLCSVAAIVCRNSRQFGYDPLLLVAVIQVEGVFDPHALGRFRSGTPSGALGLMQLKFETAVEVAHQLNIPDITREDLLKPETNLLLGAAYLTRLITQFKSFRLGLIAYNQGPVSVLQTLSDGKPLSNEYYQMVLRSYYTLNKCAKKMEMVSVTK